MRSHALLTLKCVVGEWCRSAYLFGGIVFNANPPKVKCVSRLFLVSRMALMTYYELDKKKTNCKRDSYIRVFFAVVSLRVRNMKDRPKKNRKLLNNLLLIV